jgi:AraC-like DNA-binding protein
MAPLRIASDVADFMKRPVGAGVLVETNFLWCVTPTLCGSTGWGTPTGEQAERVMRVCDAFFHPAVGPQVDVVLDGYLLEQVLPAAVMAIYEWTRRNVDRLQQRMRKQVGVPPPGLGGMLLSGIVPVLGHPYRTNIVSTPRQAYRLLRGDEGEALHDEVAEHVARFSGIPPLVGELRNLLRAKKGKLTVEDAGRQLARSPRTLQRELEAARTSFREEQARARLAAVEEALSGSDDKIAAIAARIGLSAAGLNRLIRERLGTTLEGWRRQLRAR